MIIIKKRLQKENFCMSNYILLNKVEESAIYDYMPTTEKLNLMRLLYAISCSSFLYNIVSESIPHQETFLKNITCRGMIFLIPERYIY